MQPIVDLYPIVVELDEATLGHDDGTNNPDHLATKHGSLYDAVASEASRFASERSWVLDEDARVDPDTDETDAPEVGSPTRKKSGVRFFLRNPPSPRRTRGFGPSHRHDCDDEWDGTNHQGLTNDKNKGAETDGRGESESAPSGGVFANLRSFLSGSQRRNGGLHNDPEATSH